MNEPLTKLDTRYTEPDGAVTPWEETRRVLETAELFWLSTVRSDGRPHVTPVVAVWHDGALHFSTADTEQKAVNLRENSHVILTTGCNHWQEGLDVVVEGDAIRSMCSPCGPPRSSRLPKATSATPSTNSDSQPEEALFLQAGVWLCTMG